MTPKVLKFLLVVLLLGATAALLFFQGFFGKNQDAATLANYVEQDIPYSIHGGAASYDKLKAVLEHEFQSFENLNGLMKKVDPVQLKQEGSQFIFNPTSQKLFTYTRQHGINVYPKPEVPLQEISSSPSQLPLSGRLPFMALNESIFNSFFPNFQYAPIYFGKEQSQTTLYISTKQKSADFWMGLQPSPISHDGFELSAPWIHQDIYMASDSGNLLPVVIKDDAFRQLIQPWFSGVITCIKTKEHNVAFLHGRPEADLKKFEKAMLNELSGVKLKEGIILKGTSGEPILPSSPSIYVRMTSNGMVLTTSKTAKTKTDRWVFNPRPINGSYSGQKKRIVNITQSIPGKEDAISKIFDGDDLKNLKTTEPVTIIYNARGDGVDLTIRQNSRGNKTIPTISNNPVVASEQGQNFKAFKNHRTAKNEVLFQNAQYDLVRIKGDGSTEKVKGLDKPIQGEIQQIDFFKNGKFQYLFNTASHLHLVDILGRDVRGFPKALSEEATAGVLCVDYDGKKNYRYFIPMRNGSIRGFYRDGKNLPGWSPKKDVGQILHSGQHLVFRNKDFLLFKNSDGKLISIKRNGEFRSSPNVLKEIGSGGIEFTASSHGFSGLYHSTNGDCYHFDEKNKTTVIESLKVKPGTSSVFVELDGKAPAELISQVEGGLEIGRIKNGEYKKLFFRELESDVVQLDVIKMKGKKNKASAKLKDGTIKVLEGLELNQERAVAGVFVYASKNKLHAVVEKPDGKFAVSAID